MNSSARTALVPIDPRAVINVQDAAFDAPPSKDGTFSGKSRKANLTGKMQDDICTRFNRKSAWFGLDRFENPGAQIRDRHTLVIEQFEEFFRLGPR